MQGPNYLDLARNLANDHPRATDPNHHSVPTTQRNHKIREQVGHRLISIGERLVTPPRELQLKVSTGPPCP
jgi:hypothetical protein